MKCILIKPLLKQNLTLKCFQQLQSQVNSDVTYKFSKINLFKNLIILNDINNNKDLEQLTVLFKAHVNCAEKT